MVRNGDCFVVVGVTFDFDDDEDDGVKRRKGEKKMDDDEDDGCVVRGKFS